MVTDLLQIGNKIDICSLDKDDIRRAENGKVPILASQLEAVEDNGELIIQMPVYKGKIILLSLGSRYELIFYTRKGLYRGDGPLQGRQSFHGEGHAQIRSE